MALPTIRSSFVLLSLFVLWSTAARSSPTAGTAPAPVRVGVVLDLRSYVGRERRACVSKALHDFDLKHPSYAGRVELLVRDSLGDIAASTHAGMHVYNFALACPANHFLMFCKFGVAPHISNSSI
jgi:hypothetical protein